MLVIAGIFVAFLAGTAAMHALVVSITQLGDWRPTTAAAVGGVIMSWLILTQF